MIANVNNGRLIYQTEEAQKNLRLNDYPSAINFVVLPRVPFMNQRKKMCRDWMRS